MVLLCLHNQLFLKRGEVLQLARGDARVAWWILDADQIAQQGQAKSDVINVAVLSESNAKV